MGTLFAYVYAHIPNTQRYTHSTHIHPCTQHNHHQSLASHIQNADFAKNVLFANGGWGMFSPDSLVTPAITGLNLSTTIQAIYDSKIWTVVGDNTRADLQPISLYWTFPSIKVCDSVRVVWGRRTYGKNSLL